MTIFTDRDLERVASLRMNWRKEFLLEAGRLLQEWDFANNLARRRSAEAINFRSFADHSRTTPGPVLSRPAIGFLRN